MSVNDTDPAQLREIWARVFNHVRAEVDVATVWLAMQAAVPVTLDGPFFVAGLSDADRYLSGNLEGADATAAIEAGLVAVTGRVLAFRLIEGTTLADWQMQKSPEAQAVSPLPTPSASPLQASGGQRNPPPPAPPPSGGNMGAEGRSERRPATASHDVASTWDKLTENLTQGYKSAPFTKYAPGQARFIMQAAQMISDTMDVLLPDGGATPDEHGERQLMKVLERFGAVIQLDPLFIMLEVLRLRARQGR